MVLCFLAIDSIILPYFITFIKKID